MRSCSVHIGKGCNHPHPRHRSILQEYNDTLNRGRRLSQIVDSVLVGKTPPTTVIELDDVIVYLRWLVFRQATTKRTAAFIQVGCCCHGYAFIALKQIAMYGMLLLLVAVSPMVCYALPSRVFPGTERPKAGRRS